MAAEAVGVFFYVFPGIGAIATLTINGVNPGYGSLFQVGFAFALGIAFAIMTCAPVSGGHFNPAVTVSLAIWQGFPWSKVPRYIFAQVRLELRLFRPPSLTSADFGLLHRRLADDRHVLATNQRPGHSRRWTRVKSLDFVRSFPHPVMRRDEIAYLFSLLLGALSRRLHKVLDIFS